MNFQKMFRTLSQFVKKNFLIKKKKELKTLDIISEIFEGLWTEDL